MDKKLMKSYVTIDNKLKELTQIKEDLREQILRELENSNLDKVVSDTYGTFTQATKTSYAYTDSVKALEEKVKLAKVKEQHQGKATSSVSHYLVFTAPKQNA